MNFKKYNNNLSLNPQGFQNLGFTCYYNALLQSLLSCTSFVEELLNNEETYDKNNVAKVIIQLIKELKKDNVNVNLVSKLAPLSWKVMIKKISEPPNGSIEMARFAAGQQCTVEGFNILLQTFENMQNIQNLFLHRRRNKLYCANCNNWCSEVNEMNNFFEVEPEFKLQQLDKFKNMNNDNKKDLNSFLLIQNTYVDKDHICSLCNYVGEKFKMSQLVMIPEILFVMSKKYKYDQSGGSKLNVYTDFPEELVFKSNNNQQLIYKAISQIEHSGGLNGGHYWAICKRNDKWYCINDLSVTESEYKPTNNTYVVIYHII
jgi:ubiquitin C-terminal hydrolase